MENYQLTEEIRTYCVEATSFPDGILPAFEKLRSLVPSSAGNLRLFGISRPDQTGTTRYYAAVEQWTADDPKIPGLASIVIPVGTYTSMLIRGYAADTGQIGMAFCQLLKNPDIDQNGFCLEAYEGQDVRCMVRLSPAKTSSFISPESSGTP
jgi:hypothetical protein